MATETYSILITGGNRGLGLALCQWCQQHDKPYYFTARTEEKIKEAISKYELTPAGSFPLDFEGKEASQQMDEIFEKIHNLRFVIHNASPFSLHTLEEASEEELSRLGRFAALNVIFTQKVFRILKKDPLGGRIVFIGAIIGQAGRAWRVPFSNYKAGLRGLVESLNKEDKSGKWISATHINLGTIRSQKEHEEDPSASLSELLAADVIMGIATERLPIAVEHFDLFALQDASKY